MWWTPFLYGSSMLLQVAALVFAVRMMWNRLPGRPWLTLGLAMFLMLTYRAYGVLTAGAHPFLNVSRDFSEMFTAVMSIGVSASVFASLFFIHAAQKQQERTEKALAQSQRRLKALFDNTQDAILLADDQARYVDANAAAARLTGYSVDELLRMSVVDVTPNPDRDLILKLWSQFIVAQQQDGEFPILRKDGTTATVAYRAVANILPGLHLSVLRDTTQLRAFEQELQEAGRKYRAIFEATRDGLIINAPDGTVVEANPAACRMHGYSYEEFMAAAPDRLIHPDDLPMFGSYLAIASSGGVFRAEARDLRKDGTAFPVEVVGTSFLYKGLPHILGVLRDISDRKASEREREELLQRERAARLEAERSSGAKDEFIAALSHELRTPLTPVLLAVSLIESHPGLPEAVREDVVTIRRNVELESRLIGDLLDHTRIVYGKLQMDFNTVDVHQMLRAAIDICQREDSVRLVLELNAIQHFVRGDATRLQQIFWNLINNAQKFTAEGGMVTIRTSDGFDSRMRIEIIDDGAGIDPEVLPRLFNAFEQGETRVTRQFAGLGLGLTISRRLVEAHGGTITATSPGKGKGATFTVELPTSVAAASSSGGAAPQPLSETQKPLRILLVEDHESTARALARLLRKMGHEVTPTHTLSSATAAARSGEFDLLLSDVGLPDGSGLDLMRSLRDKFEGRSIALTGYGMEEDIRNSREAGFSTHLTKPIDFQKLKAAIDQVLNATAGKRE